MVNNKSSRNTAIDLLKILACVSVVGLHTIGKDVSSINAVVYYLCGFAVPVFFTSSGYFLLNRGVVPLAYSIKRNFGIFRITVLWNAVFWVANLAIIILRKELTLWYTNLPIEIIKSLVQKGLCSHFWYLGALMIVNLLLPCLSRFNSKNRIILFTIVFACCICLQGHSIYRGYPIQSGVIQTFRIWTWLLYFLLGGILHNIEDKINSSLSCFEHTIALCAISTVTVWYQFYMGNHIIVYPDRPSVMMNAEYFYDSALTLLWVLVLFSFACRSRTFPDYTKSVEAVSKLTLGVYCIHPLFIKLTKLFIDVNSFHTAILLWIVVLLMSFGSIFAMSQISIGQYFLKI